MRGAIPPLPQYGFMALYFVKHRENFTFTVVTVHWSCIAKLEKTRTKFL